jgi:hypothetical protein
VVDIFSSLGRRKRRRIYGDSCFDDDDVSVSSIDDCLDICLMCRLVAKYNDDNVDVVGDNSVCDSTDRCKRSR